MKNLKRQRIAARAFNFDNTRWNAPHNYLPMTSSHLVGSFKNSIALLPQSEQYARNLAPLSFWHSLQKT